MISKFLKISMFFLFFASASSMAQTSYESAVDCKASGMLDAYTVVDHWTSTSTVNGFSFNVKVVSYKNGSSHIDVPSEVSNQPDYLLIDNCSYDVNSKELKCRYQIRKYVKTELVSEPTYADGSVWFYTNIAHDIYESVGSGSFIVKRP